MVEYLLLPMNKCNPGAVDRWGISPLFDAIKHGNLSVARILYENGARVYSCLCVWIDGSMDQRIDGADPPFPRPEPTTPIHNRRAAEQGQGGHLPLHRRGQRRLRAPPDALRVRRGDQHRVRACVVV